MNSFLYLALHIEPLVGLIIGSVIVLTCGYLHWKMDKKIRVESTLNTAEKSIKNPLVRVISSFGMAFGAIMIIVAIKFLTS